MELSRTMAPIDGAAPIARQVEAPIARQVEQRWPISRSENPAVFLAFGSSNR
jgi:hypothetical protein